MLDSKLNPWLIEVNLSPACAERTEWLVKMLDDMGEGLLTYLENRILTTHPSWEHPLDKRLEEILTASKSTSLRQAVMEPIDQRENTCASDNKWIKVYDAIEEKEWIPNAATFGLKNT